MGFLALATESLLQHSGRATSTASKQFLVRILKILFATRFFT
jgi:hypothetical protein